MMLSILWIILIISAIVTIIDVEGVECITQEYMGEIGPVCTFSTRDNVSEPVIFLMAVSFGLVIMLSVYGRVIA